MSRFQLGLVLGLVTLVTLIAVPSSASPVASQQPASSGLTTTQPLSDTHAVFLPAIARNCMQPLPGANALTLVDVVGAAFGGAVVYHTWVYVAAADTLRIIDLTSGPDLREIEHIILPIMPDLMTVAADRLYVADDDTLVIVDISTPTAPRVMGQYFAGATINDIFAMGHYVYIARDTLDIIQVSGSRAPHLVGRYFPVWPVIEVFVTGSTAYVMEVETVPIGRGNRYVGHIRAIDISTPASPRALAEVASPYDLGGHRPSFVTKPRTPKYAVVGTTLYTTGQIVDVSNPSSPRVLGALPVLGRGVIVEGNYAYVPYDNLLLILDISTPTAPREVSRSEYGATTLEMVSNGQALLLGNGEDTAYLTIVDASNPQQTRLKGRFTQPRLGTFDPLAGKQFHALFNRYAYIKGRSALYVLDMAIPEAPRPIKSLALAHFTDMRAQGNHIFLLTQTYDSPQLRTLDASNPATPLEVGNYQIPGITTAFDAEASLVYLAYEREELGSPSARYATGLRILDMTHPATPREVGVFRIPGETIRFVDVHIVGGYAYLLLEYYARHPYRHDLLILDIANPAQPRRVNQFPVTGDRLLLVRAGFAYLSTEQAMRVINVNDPANPLFWAHLEMPAIQRLTEAGCLAYVSTRNTIHLLDLTLPGPPGIITTHPLPLGARDIAVGYRHVYVLSAEGLRIFRTP